jgi:hypothetical protein
MKTENKNYPVMDIHQAAFLDFNGIQPNLTKQGTRVVFEFPNSKRVLELIQSYNSNPAIPIADFCHHLRKLRSQMLAAR